MLLSNTANLITQGTSYTINNIEEITNTTTATNHGQETADAIPIRSDLTNGPYIHNPEMKLPHLVLTKTHCTGYCDFCTQNKSKKYMQHFEAGCFGSKKNVGNQTVKSRYHPSLVRKAVHLFRSPYDNIGKHDILIHARHCFILTCTLNSILLETRQLPACILESRTASEMVGQSSNFRFSTTHRLE